MIVVACFAAAAVAANCVAVWRLTRPRLCPDCEEFNYWTEERFDAEYAAGRNVSIVVPVAPSYTFKSFSPWGGYTITEAPAWVTNTTTTRWEP